MKTELKGGRIFKDGVFMDNASLTVEYNSGTDEYRVIDLGNSIILPSFCDVHVHFREPGFGYKETIRNGSLAGAHGGYTTVATMPNLKPVPHNLETLQAQLDIIERDAVIHVRPYGTITETQTGRGELSDMEALAPHVIAFSDDGKGVQDEGLMRAAMEVSRALGKLIVAHCEDEQLLEKGDVRGSEWRQIERDLKLADETGCGYHVCHISCKESVEVIREAKKSGVDVTCETAPHYLVLDSGDVWEATHTSPEFGGRFKMNPPIKDAVDRQALIDGILDGTVDMIATDHAPHSVEEKSRGFEKSANGITGLECAFPVLYSELVQKGIISFDRLVEIMAISPRSRFNIVENNSFVVIDPITEFRIDSSQFLSSGKCTPFEGWKVSGRTLFTICDGRIVYEEK